MVFDPSTDMAYWERLAYPIIAAQTIINAIAPKNKISCLIE
jgi:hypothetical protein